MTQYSAQEIFANIVWETKPDAKTRLSLFELIENNLEEINIMLAASLEKGETEFQFDETRFIQ